MDSLLATYASSDEEEENQPIESKSLSSSSSSSSLLFSKLPQPKSQSSNPFSSNPKPKKLVHFHPPKPLLHHDDHDDDHDDDKKEKTKKHDSIPLQAPSVKSFLSTIPAPRNSASLGPGSSSSGTARKSILEANVPALSNSDTIVDHNQLKDENISYNEYPNVSADYTGYDYSVSGEYQYDYGPASVDQGNYYEYGQYEESKWIDRSGGNVEPQIPVARPLGKRGRNEIPAEVIEVNQDELMKNRPRPDQAKLTGIAFGPSYQPTSSTKGKPSKLHKRKHQIGSLYFDMRSKEAELAERRSKGFLTKAETQAKYGW